jgi:hypothetical protein
MRHANSKTTLDLYAKVVTRSKRSSHGSIVEGGSSPRRAKQPSATAYSHKGKSLTWVETDYVFRGIPVTTLKMWWPETGSNRRRRPFQGRALPLSYLALAFFQAALRDRQDRPGTLSSDDPSIQSCKLFKGISPPAKSRRLRRFPSIATSRASAKPALSLSPLSANKGSPCAEDSASYSSFS